MWVSHTKHQIITSSTFNVNKKPQGSSAATLKKSNCEKLKKFQSLILCYNCGKKEHIYFNCPHPSKNNAHQIQTVKTSDISSALKYLKNLKGFQQSEVSKDCHLNHKKWLFQLWSWFQKEVKNAELLLIMIQISILSIKI